MRKFLVIGAVGFLVGKVIHHQLFGWDLKDTNEDLIVDDPEYEKEVTGCGGAATESADPEEAYGNDLTGCGGAATEFAV